ncbi:MAG: restriction endonuclease subunit S [Flavobacterium micromati]|nr:restriction endonuclease subunit S [Flavobacterium micromati]
MKNVRLDSVCEIIAGQSPPSDTYNQDKVGIPFFQGKADFRELYPIVRYWCSKPTKISIPEDILFSVRAPVGPTNINNVKACIGRGISAIRCTDKIIQKYLLHYLRANEHKIAALGTGSTFKAITISALKKLQIPLPPLPQQQKIANILDAADALRQKDKALLAKYDELTQALFLDMFGDPVSNPKGWEKVRFDELVSNNCPLTYGIVQPGDEFENGVPCVRPVDLISQYINIENLKRIDPVISNKFKRTLLKGGELLLSVRGSVGIISIANKSLKDSNVTRGIVPIWFDSDVSNKLFFYHLYNTMEIQREVKNLAKGATLIQINLKDLRELKIIKPPIKLQNQFAERIQIIEQQKAIAQKSLEKSEQLFNSLLQKAFKEELL